MKPPALLPFAFALLTLAARTSFSQEAPGIPGLFSPAGALAAPVIIGEDLFTIRHELQLVTLPTAMAMTMIPELLDETKIEAANAKLQTLMIEGKATLSGWLILETKSGQRAVVEAIDEVRYATEFDPGQVHVTVQTNDPNAEEGDVIKVKRKIQADGLDPAPTAFETRNVGVTFEVEPIVAPDGTVDLNMVPQHVRLVRFNAVKVKYGEGGGKEMTVAQPQFSTNKVSTSLTMKSGTRKLIGTFQLPDRPGFMELFLLRVEVRKVPAR